jgi:ABC-type glycerol-3-phosphate transport system substrate-binding protein
MLLTSALVPITTAKTAHAAQNNGTLVLSVPSMWENTVTDDLLADFESQYGVDVALTYNETSFFGFGPGGSDTTAVADRLDDTSDFVSTADVLYVDTSSLTAEDTQAGYFLDLMPLVQSDPDLDTSDFIPAVWNSYQWDNGLWAMPISTDVILLTYDQTLFDNAGIAYPNERWTIDDFANAARALATYNADGTVDTPGFTVVSGGNNQSVFLRAVAGVSLYDSATMPNTPKLDDAALEYTLQVWYELVQEGVVGASGGGRDNNVPLRVEGINGYGERGFSPNNDDQEETGRYASLLPGGIAGLSVQGFAVSAGTQYPEIAYALTKYLTSRSELASNQFSASPARYSLATSAEQTTQSDQQGGPGQPGGFMMANNIPDTIQPTFDQGLTVGLPVSELRYASYLSTAVNEMNNNGGDAAAALQTVEALAVSDMQTAQARLGTYTIYITPPAAGPVLAAGEIALNCAVNSGFGGRGPGSQMMNQDQWDQLIADFVAADPEVGAVTLESVQGTDLASLTEEYDCIILPSNVVDDADLTTILSLDPLIDTDTTFDRNDVIGNTMTQLQRDNKTWALPIAIEPQMLTYDSTLFQQAGATEPVNGWTTDQFVDALNRLKTFDPDNAPFALTGQGSTAVLMLIAAFGGLPMDYRTDPPTINFTDATNVAAIQQVLDLAANGYIATNVEMDPETPIAITTGNFNQFRRAGPPDAQGSTQDTTATTLYPQGTQYGAITYSITTGYISATAQNPEADYRFLSLVAQNPQLFSGMPARSSLLSDPDVIASQGEDIVSVYQQVDALLRASNTIIFPSLSGEGGMGATSYMQQYWLNQALQNYLAGSDLAYELSEAETYTKAYQECTAQIVVDTTTGDAFEQRRAYAQAVMTCATTVDPTFSLGD